MDFSLAGMIILLALVAGVLLLLGLLGKGLDPGKDWAELGIQNPYYGVLSSEANRGSTLESSALDAFYRDGRNHMDTVLKLAKEHFSFEPKGRALDFGCGVGRLTCALSPYFSEVVGLDISPGMLSKAKDYSDSRGLNNISYVDCSSGYTIPPGHFDLVHTYIVLQHMKAPRGEEAVRSMLCGLKHGGFGAIHFTHGHIKGRLYHAMREMAKSHVLTRAAYNILLGSKWDAPRILMTAYSIRRVLAILREAEIEKMFVHQIDDWGDLGLFVFFKKGMRSEWSNRRPS